MAAEGVPFPWRWNGGTISTELDVIWGMSAESMAVVRQAARDVAPFDSVLLAVLAKRIESIAGKMTNTMLRTARSGVINSGRDFSCCILSAAGDLLGVGEALPMHVMVGSDMMARSMMEFHPDLARGDAFLHNSPYHGCSHPADLSVLAPVIDDEGVHRFTVLAKAHQADIGNSVPTTYLATARDVYEEGALIFPAVKVQRDYRDIDDIVRMCMMRIRVPEQWRGDYLAGLGAARIGERELLALGAEVGWDTLEEYVGAWFDYSEERMIAAIRRLPSRRATAVSVHDAFPGTPPDGVAIRTTVAIDGDAAMIDVDLRDNPDALPCGLNVSESCTRSAAMIGIFNSLDSKDVPPNAGSFRRIRMHLRDNGVVGVPRHPASCSVATTNIADRVVNGAHRAMAEIADGFGMAEAGAIQVAGSAVISGRDPRNGGRPFVNQLSLGDTVGAAAPNQDGWLTLSHIGAAGLCFVDSVEVDEMTHPIHIAGRSLVADSEGPGKFRGAPSSRVEFAAVGCSLQAVYASDGTDNPPLGARGGMTGAAARNYRRTASGEVIACDGWGDITLEPGDSAIGVSCGGGGYGSPLERDPARVKHDVDEGYVTPDRARAVYGVAFDADGCVDPRATAVLRAHLAKSS